MALSTTERARAYFLSIIVVHRLVSHIRHTTLFFEAPNRSKGIHAKTCTCRPPRAKAEFLRAGFEIEAQLPNARRMSSSLGIHSEGELALPGAAALSLIVKYLSAALKCGQTINQRSGDVAEFQSRTKLHDTLSIAKCTKRAPARLPRRLDSKSFSSDTSEPLFLFWSWL